MEHKLRMQIKETLREILEESDMETTTEHQIRRLASNKLDLDLDKSEYKAYVRHVVNSFLEEQKAKQEDDEEETGKQEQEYDDEGNLVICRLSAKRKVTIQNFRGANLVSIREYYYDGGAERPTAKDMDCQESGNNPQKIIPSSSIDSDAHSSQRVTTVLLNEFNYLPWSRAVTIALGGRSRLGFINGKDQAPDSSSPEFDNWLAKDQMVMSWILNSMERHLAEMFSYYQSSLELWDAVKEMYGNQNNSARIFQIQQEIAGLHQNGQPFVNLLSKFKGLWNELDIYRPHSVDPIVLRARKEEDQIFQLLASLGSDYEDLRSHILMNDELPPLKSVCATIQREEIRRKVMTRENPSKMAENRAFVAQKMAEQGTPKFAEKQPFKGISLNEEQWSALRKNIPAIEKAVKDMQDRDI